MKNSYNRRVHSNVEKTCCGKLKRRTVAKVFALLSIVSGLVALIAAAFVFGFQSQVNKSIDQEATRNQNAFRLNLINEKEYHANLKKFTFERSFVFCSWIVGFTYAGMTIPKGIILASGLSQDKPNMMCCWLVLDMVSNGFGILSVCGVFIICGVMVFYNLLHVGLAFLILVVSVIFLTILFYSWTNVYKLYKTIRIEQDVIIHPEELS